MAEIVSRLSTALTGRYTIDRKLGDGGMATVFLAHDLKHSRPVALKVLDPDLAAVIGPDRFLREIAVTARLVHPHILPLLDSGEADGLLYYTMPVVEGRSLREGASPDSPARVEDVLRIVSEVADALDRAHEEGIVHRDVKPGNILLDRGHALVADFGVAGMIDATDGGRLTATGLTVGTGEYMSPEQLSGHRVDGRSDVYSLACVAYELLAGRPVFTGSPQAVARQHLATEPVPLTTLRPALPPAIDDVFRRALAKDREDRHSTARAFAAAMREAVEAPRDGAAPLPGGRRRRMAVGAAVAAVTILTVVWFTVLRPAPPTIRSVAVLPLANISGDDDQTYFIDGLHDALIGELQRLSAFDRVISRTSVLRYRDTDERPSSPRIAAALGVDALIEGAVSRALDQITVRLRLIAVDPEERVLWNQAYTGDAGDVMTLFRTITDEIADAIALSLTPTEEARLAEREPVDPAALDAYLRGRAGLDERSDEGFQLAADYFERAIAIDPGYAAAWAGLSDTYNLLAQYGHITLEVARENARRAAERAIEADSTSAEALVSLAEVRFASREWTAAEEAYRRALAFNPGFAQGHHFFGWFLAHIGRSDEALERLTRAGELDPLAPTIAADHSGALYYARRFDEARAQADRALDLRPEHPWALVLSSRLATQRGRYAEATRYALRFEAVWDERVHLEVLAATGREEEMRALVEQLVDRAGGRERVDPSLAVTLGSAFATLGDVDEAIGWLEHAVDRGYAAGGMSLLAWPPFDPLRDDGRYQVLLERMGYPR
ncbi:MAG TPA: protein kinase [Longimicrobiales bacterium]|nr:protein kinase [Longimicrobiales bacterium]